MTDLRWVLEDPWVGVDAAGALQERRAWAGLMQLDLRVFVVGPRRGPHRSTGIRDRCSESPPRSEATLAPGHGGRSASPRPAPKSVRRSGARVGAMLTRRLNTRGAHRLLP